MLKQADGSYACVAESSARFTLGEVHIYLELKQHVLFVNFYYHDLIFILLRLFFFVLSRQKKNC